MVSFLSTPFFGGSNRTFLLGDGFGELSWGRFFGVSLAAAGLQLALAPFGGHISNASGAESLELVLDSWHSSGIIGKIVGAKG